MTTQRTTVCTASGAEATLIFTADDSPGVAAAWSAAARLIREPKQQPAVKPHSEAFSLPENASEAVTTTATKRGSR
jgi:hypothetical protein